MLLIEWMSGSFSCAASASTMFKEIILPCSYSVYYNETISAGNVWSSVFIGYDNSSLEKAQIKITNGSGASRTISFNVFTIGY